MELSGTSAVVDTSSSFVRPPMSAESATSDLATTVRATALTVPETLITLTRITGSGSNASHETGESETPHETRGTLRRRALLREVLAFAVDGASTHTGCTKSKGPSFATEPLTVTIESRRLI